MEKEESELSEEVSILEKEIRRKTDELELNKVKLEPLRRLIQIEKNNNLFENQFEIHEEEIPENNYQDEAKLVDDSEIEWDIRCLEEDGYVWDDECLTEEEFDKRADEEGIDFYS